MRLRTTRAFTLLILVTIAGCARPARIGADPEVFKTVDALYTAVSLRDVGLVEPCLAALKGFHEAGKLPDDAFATLEAIIDEAKGGAWEDAQTRLSRFMQGQRRER